jgi:transcriptional regulator of acetoin/glycerol metabolism
MADGFYRTALQGTTPPREIFMMKSIETIIESRKAQILPRRRPDVYAWCHICNDNVRMISPESAALLSRVPFRAIFQRVETGKLHFTEIQDGTILICTNSLLINITEGEFSDRMRLVYKQIQDMACMEIPVLLESEAGTVNELAARAIHYSGPRKNKPFVVVNCSGRTEALLASQLFGQKRGAFTGALCDHVGLFEGARGGSILLDYIEDIPMGVQHSLLRVLQDKEITRRGESVPRKIDVRVIAATHRDLSKAVAEGKFRQDLFICIQAGRIKLPCHCLPFQSATLTLSPHFQ